MSLFGKINCVIVFLLCCIPIYGVDTDFCTVVKIDKQTMSLVRDSVQLSDMEIAGLKRRIRYCKPFYNKENDTIILLQGPLGCDDGSYSITSISPANDTVFVTSCHWQDRFYDQKIYQLEDLCNNPYIGLDNAKLVSYKVFQKMQMDSIEHRMLTGNGVEWDYYGNLDFIIIKDGDLKNVTSFKFNTFNPNKYNTDWMK